MRVALSLEQLLVPFAEMTLPGEDGGRDAGCNVGGCCQVVLHVPGCPRGSWAVTGQGEGGLRYESGLIYRVIVT